MLYSVPIVNVELNIELNKQAANAKTVLDSLEQAEWEHAVESSIYLEVLSETSLSYLQEQQDTNVKAMVQNLREKEWEHAAECIVYLEVLYETAVAYSQESNDMKEKLCKVVSCLCILLMLLYIPLHTQLRDSRLYISCVLYPDIKKLKDASRFKKYVESLVLIVLLDNWCQIQQVQKGMLKTEIEELHRRLEEIEDSTWRSKTELSIYFTVFDDTARKLSEELLHLRADLSNEVCTAYQFLALRADHVRL